MRTFSIFINFLSPKNSRQIPLCPPESHIDRGTRTATLVMSLLPSSVVVADAVSGCIRMEYISVILGLETRT